MIIRIVKLTLQKENIEAFIQTFYSSQKTILNFEGCESVKLFKNSKNDNVIFTHSKWNSEDDLNNYRNSDFFRGTWSNVKPMFSAKPEAWSLMPVNNV